MLYKILGKNYNRVTVSSIDGYGKHNEIQGGKKINRPPESRIITGGSQLLPPPEKVSKTPLKERIAAVASVVGFGMMIGGTIIGSFPLFAIGMTIGVIGMFYASLEYELRMEEKEYYDPKCKNLNFGEKLDYCMSSEKELLNNLMCKALDGVTELIKQGDASDIKGHVENSILTAENIAKILKCLKRKDEKVKSSAASLIRAALIQNQIGNGIKGNILIQLAVMARNENNNDSSNNAILKEYLGEEALNLLKKLEFLCPCKISEISKYIEDNKQYPVKGKDLSEIINKIKKHTPVSQKTNDKIKHADISIELAELGSN